MSSIASTVFGDSLERASVMVRLTAETSLSLTGQSWLRCRGCPWQPQPTVEILCDSPSTSNIRPWCHLRRTRNWVHRAGPVLIMTLQLFLNTVSNSARKNGTLMFVYDAEFSRYKSDWYQEVLIVATNIYQCCLALNHI